ncbi:MAG: DUF4350 domain-containing protein [Kibdelosporangium sp.]
MSTAVSPDTRRIWRAARGPVLVAAVVLAAAVVISLLQADPGQGALEPDSHTPAGSRALARLLGAYGVEIKRADTTDDAGAALDGDATLLITQPNWVAADQLTQLRDKARTTVAIGATGAALSALAPAVRAAGTVPPDVRQPGCSLNAAGAARLGGVHYDAPSSCYEGTLVQAGAVTLLGDATPLTNDVLDEDGNAALSLRLLGEHKQLVWYLPTLSDVAGGGEQSFYDLVPSGWWFGLIQVVIAVVLLMLWRARRLGPVVVEPLPVVVRAAETAEGRARLYRRARATDHAADALRRATLTRLTPLLGLASDAVPAAVAASVAARTGRPAQEVHAILYGPPPGREQDLVRLADQLDALAGATTAMMTRPDVRWGN